MQKRSLKKFKLIIKRWNIAKLTRWIICFISIGLIAGIGSIIFSYACQIANHFFMDFIAGYRPEKPAGEFHFLSTSHSQLNKVILLLLPSIGGLLSGWLVYTFAPEAEGHGTDAAINAYHNNGGKIRSIVPIIKTLASSITLSTGGSGGREGPIAQIGAGFGSYLGKKLNLSDRERRIMMAAGIAAGVGSIFRAPLAGALFAAEVLYKDTEFESEVIIPAGISSVVSYCLFCLVFGWGSLFNAPIFKFQNPIELGGYLILSIILVIIGMFYVKIFYGIGRFFKTFKKIPNHIKPAIGGLLTGIIGYFIRDSLAFGYGFIQSALYNEYSIKILIILAIGKIFTTSFSIASGGSGGVFGPSIVIGGAIGGAVGKVLNQIAPSIIIDPGAFVIIGMAGFFTSVSNTPISTIIFVSEMTNSYQLLLPNLMVCSVTYALSRHWTIFNCQVKNRLHSPAHASDFFVNILEGIHIKDILHKIESVELIQQDTSFNDIKKYLANTTQQYFPVIDEEHRLKSIFSINDIRPMLFKIDIQTILTIKDIGTKNIITTNPYESLDTVFKKFTIKNIDSIPVVNEKNHDTIIGMISRKSVIEYYNNKIEKLRFIKN